MMTTRTFCSATVLALAIIIGSVSPGYAGDPCCDWVYRKYINLKTGKEVSLATGTTIALAGRVEVTTRGQLVEPFGCALVPA